MKLSRTMIYVAMSLAELCLNMCFLLSNFVLIKIGTDYIGYLRKVANNVKLNWSNIKIGTDYTGLLLQSG